jgi:hypothetical protein
MVMERSAEQKIPIRRLGPRAVVCVQPASSKHLQTAVAWGTFTETGG